MSNYTFKKYNNKLGYDEYFRLKQEEKAVWYEGKSNELLNFYGSKISVAPAEMFRNTKDYFWRYVMFENQMKNTHSGLPKTIVDIVVAVTGKPKIEAKAINAEDESLKTNAILSNALVQKMLEENNFFYDFKNNQLPYTLVIGDGVYLINYNMAKSDLPIWEYIDGRNVEYEFDGNRIKSIITRRYYERENKTYVLFDTRSILRVKTDDGYKTVSKIKYELYQTSSKDSTAILDTKIKLDTLEETAGLIDLEIENFDYILAVPVFNGYNKRAKRGESIFATKIDLFDDLDQSLSQASTVTRMSSPIDYVPEGLMEYDSEGKPKTINRFDRRFITYPQDRNAQTQDVNRIITSQPDLHFFEQYDNNQLEILMKCIMGIISPSTLGLYLARNDNATAQREKEKVTLVTRDTIVDMQTPIIKRLLKISLELISKMQTSVDIDTTAIDITVNFPEYANPSFDSKLVYLSDALVKDAISPEQYIEELWEDALSNDEKEREIAWIKERKSTGIVDPNMIDTIMLE